MAPSKLALAGALFLLLQPCSAAEELDPIDPAAIDMLKRAYHVNGDSMVRWGSLDAEDLPVVVKPTIMHPVAKWTEKNDLDKQADGLPPRRFAVDICTLHHMRKVVTGSSWRCRK